MGCGSSTPRTVEGSGVTVNSRTPKDTLYVGPNYKKIKHLGETRAGPRRASCCLTPFA